MWTEGSQPESKKGHYQYVVSVLKCGECVFCKSKKKTEEKGTDKNKALCCENLRNVTGRVVGAVLDSRAERRGWWWWWWWGLCHSPSSLIGSRCEAAWPLRQQGVRAALRAQPRADGIADRQASPRSPPQIRGVNPILRR